jgi:STAM-binding protein
MAFPVASPVPTVAVAPPPPVTAASPAAAAPRPAAPSVRSPIVFALRQLRIPQDAFSSFAWHVRQNTAQGIETCGILCGKEVRGQLVLSHIVLPPQSGTSDTCHMVDEGRLLDYQLQNDLMSLGWVHTHPTQGCFLSSIDLHTSAAYQALLDEAIAVVVSPSQGIGVFALTPEGLKLVLRCSLRGFHPHSEPNIYKRDEARCIFDPALKVTVADLRVKN